MIKLYRLQIRRKEGREVRERMERNRKERRKGGGIKRKNKLIPVDLEKARLVGHLAKPRGAKCPSLPWRELATPSDTSLYILSYGTWPCAEHEVIGDILSTSQVTSGCAGV